MYIWYRAEDIFWCDLGQIKNNNYVVRFIILYRYCLVALLIKEPHAY
jgi:hypothetical protein